MPEFNKNYFERKGSNYRSYKDMMMIKKTYFPKVIESVALNKNTHILDIGCAFGYFLKCCDEFGCETDGIDISSYAIEQAKKETKAKLKVHNLNDGISVYKDDSFDVITMFDVIEHLESPYNALKEIYRILKANGKLIITTPNLNAIDKLVKNKKWHGFQDESHRYLFYPDSLTFLVERAGFAVEKIETPFHPLPKLIQKLANKTHLGGQIWLVAKKE